MTDITEAQVCDAIKTTLEPAVSVAQSYNELTEGVNDTPLLQVYPESGETSFASNTDRRTFGGGSAKPLRQDLGVYHADYFAKQRSNIADDMNVLVPGITAIKAKLNEQDQKPYFDLVGIKAFRWRWERTTWDYGGVAFIGARFYLDITIF